MRRVHSKTLPKRGHKRVVRTSPELHQYRQGQYDYRPIEEMRPIIKEMVAAGLSQGRIANLVINERTGKPISVETLVKYYARELEIGLDEANVAMSRSVFSQGTGFPGIPNPNHGRPDKRKYIEGVKNPAYRKIDKNKWLVPPIVAVPSMSVWWEKTRAGKKEVQVNEHTGKDGQPLPSQTTIIVLPANGRETGGHPILDRLPRLEHHTISVVSQEEGGDLSDRRNNSHDQPA